MHRAGLFSFSGRFDAEFESIVPQVVARAISFSYKDEANPSEQAIRWKVGHVRNTNQPVEPQGVRRVFHQYREGLYGISLVPPFRSQGDQRFNGTCNRRIVLRRRTDPRQRRTTDQTAGGLLLNNRPKSEALCRESFELADRRPHVIALDHDVVPKKLSNLWFGPQGPQFLEILFSNGLEPKASGVKNRLHRSFGGGLTRAFSCNRDVSR